MAAAPDPNTSTFGVPATIAIAVKSFTALYRMFLIADWCRAWRHSRASAYSRPVPRASWLARQSRRRTCFSTIKVCPRARCNRSATIRAAVSTPPRGATGAMTFTVRWDMRRFARLSAAPSQRQGSRARPAKTVVDSRWPPCCFYCVTAAWIVPCCGVASFHWCCNRRQSISSTRTITVKLLAPCNKPLLLNGLTHLFNQLKVVMEIVNGVKHRAEDLAGFVEVMQVRSAEISAGVAAA